MGTEFELWLALRTFRRAEEVDARPRPTEESNLAASSMNGGRIPIVGHNLTSSLRARCGSQLFTVGHGRWHGGWSRRAEPCAQRRVLKHCSRRARPLRRRRLAHLLKHRDAEEFRVNVSITCQAKHATLSDWDAKEAGGSGMRPRKFTQIHLGAGALDALRLGTKLHLNDLVDGAGCGLAPVDGERAASLGKMALSCLGQTLADQRAACMAPENTAARTHG